MSTIRTAADAIRRGDVQLTDITRSEGMPDADMALIDLLNALAWWRKAITSGDDMGVAVAVNRVHAAGDSLADTITHESGVDSPAVLADSRDAETDSGHPASP